MSDQPASGATPGLMHVAAPPARNYADTGRGWMVFAAVMLLHGLCVHGFGREGP
jgi:hypothetical protein